MGTVRLVYRISVLAALATAAVLAAGCGGDEATGGGADLVPGSAALYVSLNTDFEGDQWRQAEALVERFPAGDEAIAGFLRELQRDDLDFETDIKPALGPEVVLAVLDFEREDFVVLTQPADPAKFRELVEESEEDPGVTEEIEDWWAAAESQDVLDRFKAAREDGSLTDEDAFDETMGDLPEDALVRGYVNGEPVVERARAEAGATPDQRALFECFAGDGSTPALGFAVSAEEDGARIVGDAHAEGVDVPGGDSWDVLGNHVGDALGFLAVRGLGEQLREVLRCVSDADEDVSRQIAQAELVLGASIEEDVLPLFDDETVLAVHPAGEAASGGPLGLATFSLVTEVEDDEQARETLEKVAARLSAFTDDVTVEDVSVDGAEAKRVTVGGEGISVFYGVYEGKLVLTTSEDGIRNVAGAEEGNAAYEDALEAADAPSDSSSVAWVDVPAVVALVGDLFAGEGESIPPDAEENLEPLRSVLFWSEGGDSLRFEGFLQID